MRNINCNYITSFYAQGNLFAIRADCHSVKASHKKTSPSLELLWSVPWRIVISVCLECCIRLLVQLFWHRGAPRPSLNRDSVMRCEQWRTNSLNAIKRSGVSLLNSKHNMTRTHISAIAHEFLLITKSCCLSFWLKHCCFLICCTLICAILELDFSTRN